MIAKELRLKNQEIQAVLSKGRKIENPNFLIFYIQNSLNKFRLGVITSKKITKLAVERNYFKRVIKVIFRDYFLRKNFQFLKSYDIVIIIKKPFLRKDFLEIKNNLFSLFENIIKQKDSD